MNNDKSRIEAEVKSSVSSQKTPFWSGQFPTTVDLLAILGIFLVAQLAAIAITFLLGYSYDPTALSGVSDSVERVAAQQRSGMFSLVSYLITMSITILGALILRKFRGGRGSVARFSIVGFNPTVLLWGMISLISVAIIFDPLMRFLPSPPELTGRGWAMVVTLMVAAPIFEEFLCRGIILESVRAKSGVWRACVVSSIFFAVLHFHPTAAVNALIIGLLLSYLYVRTNSLFAPIILHSFNNALAFLLVWFGYEKLTLWELVDNKMIYAVIYGVAFVVFITSLIQIIRQLSEKQKEEEIVTEE